jgi:hypothetical protein
VPGSHPLRAQPGIDVFSDLILGDTVSLLDYSLELIATTGNAVQIIVSEIAPFFLHAAFQLFPVSFNAIPVHEYLLCHLMRQDMTRGYTPLTFSDRARSSPCFKMTIDPPLPQIFFERAKSGIGPSSRNPIRIRCRACSVGGFR